VRDIRRRYGAPSAGKEAGVAAMIASTPSGGPYTLRQLGPHPGIEPGLAFVSMGSLVAGHWLVLDDEVYMVAGCPTREAAEAARRLLSGECRRT
jgi:hypothetical protein